MCFHTKQTKSALELENRYKAKFESGFEYNPYGITNGFDFPKTPVITNQNPEVIQMYQWGLIPTWAKNESIKQYTLNARIETINEKPSFKNSVNKRCLIPIDGFYEWQWLDPKGKRKQKYLITSESEELFTLGGIYSEWVDKLTGEVINTYSIVTTEANGLMAEIHNSKMRMPIILTIREEIKWLENVEIETFKKPSFNIIANEIT